MFTERQKRILLKLIKNKNGLSLVDLEKRLDVSQRTLYREFADLRPNLEQQGVILNNDKGVYKIDGDNKTLSKIEDNIINQPQHYHLSASSRQNAIAAMLLLSAKEMKMSNIAINLGVSQGTVQRDLKEISQSLKAYGLCLYRKKGVGVIISGSEAVRRNLFCKIVLNEINEYSFLLGLQKKKEKIDNYFAMLIPSELLIKSYEILATYVLPKIRGIYDRQLISLVLMFSTSVYRLSTGNPITQIDDNKVDMKYLGLTYQFLSHLNYSKKIKKITKEEINFLATQLQNSDKQITNNNFDEMSLSTSVQVKEFISLISVAYSWDFTRNPTFFEKLTNHIDGLLKKRQMPMPETNLSTVKVMEEKYQKLSLIINEKWKEVFPKKYLNLSERQLLLLYFANECEKYKFSHKLRALIICENGFSTSQILKSRLSQELPEINQIDTTKITKLNQIDLANYDIVLTTVDLPGFSREYQVVSPLLLNGEVQKIKNYLKTYQYKYSNFNKANYHKSFLAKLLAKKKKVDLYTEIVTETEVFKLLNTEKQSLEQVIKSAIELLPKNVVTNSEQVTQKLVHRINISPIGLPNTHLALVHASSLGVQKSFVAVCQLQIPVKLLSMENQEIQVKRFLILLAPANSATEELRALGAISSSLVINKESMEVFEKGTANQLKEFLAKQFLPILSKNDN